MLGSVRRIKLPETNHRHMPGEQVAPIDRLPQRVANIGPWRQVDDRPNDDLRVVTLSKLGEVARQAPKHRRVVVPLPLDNVEILLPTGTTQV